MSTRTVQALLDDIRLLGDGQYALVQAVRALVEEVMPSASEEVKYGGILFSCDVQFGGVFAYRNHVSVEFGSGAGIADAFGHLEGGGKRRRHIKLFSVEDIEAKQLAQYLPLALQAAQRTD